MDDGRFAILDSDDLADELRDRMAAEFGEERIKTDAIDALIYTVASHTEANLRDHYANLLGMSRRDDETDREFRERIAAEVEEEGGHVPPAGTSMSDDDETFEPEDSSIDIEVGDSGVDVDEMIEGSDGVDMPGLSDGLDPELARDLKGIVEDVDGVKTATIRPRSGDFMPSASSAAATASAEDYEAFEVEVKHGQADRLLKTIYPLLQETNDKYGRTETLVLGKPQYAVLEPWAQAEHNESIERTLPVSDIIVVDGPMIHPVVSNDVMLTEYLRDKDES